MNPSGKGLIFTLLIISRSIAGWGQLPYAQHPAPSNIVVSQARMNDLVVDAANNKWIAFGNYGVGIYDGSAWTMIDSASGALPTDSITSIAFDGSGNAWFGAKTGAVYKSGGTYTAYNNFNSGLPPSPVTKVFCEPGMTWFGTYAGLVLYDGNNWYTYNTGNSGLANDSITCILRDGSGNLWIGTRNGLSRYDNSSWLNYTASNSILDTFIIDLETDNWNRLWISCGTLNSNQTLSTKGVYLIENGNLHDFATFYLNNEAPVSYPKGTTLSRDDAGRVIFAASLFNTVSQHPVIARIDGGSLDFFRYWGLNPGVGTFGSLFTMDHTGLLWTVPRFRFYFYSLDFSGYVPVYWEITHKNHRTLDINDVRAGINVSGDMHWDLSYPRYEVPKGSGKHSVYASALWIGGYDSGGQLHVAAQTYRQSGVDYWPGPIGSISVPFDTASCYQFDKIWKVDRWKIVEFQNEFSTGNVSNGTYPVPDEIASWPAMGNGMVNGPLAPFIDLNADGLYNPLSGDYPDIKGDQMLFYIFNDSLGVHSETGGLKMGIEVQAKAYAYNCPNIADSNIVLNRTTLYHYTIINRSSNDYDSVYTGFWCDNDLGYVSDDYIGCDSTRAAGFVYNGDNNDETVAGYGLNPPMQNVKILRGTSADPGDGLDNDLDGFIDEPGERTTMNHFMYYNGINNSPQGNPNTAPDFYHYLQSVWLDGMHLTYGDDGRNPLTAPTNFMFSGVPYSGSGWTEGLSGNVPEDRRFIMGSGPASLDAGDTLEFDIAYVFTWDPLNPNGLNTSIGRNQADLDRVQYWFDTDSFPSCENYVVGLNHTAFEEMVAVVPNPSRERIFIVDETGTVTRTDYSIYNLQGKRIHGGLLHSRGIDVSKFTPGSYFIRISYRDRYVVRKFIVIP